VFDVSYHFEGVELFLDLLCKHRREPVAGCNVSSAVIVLRRPRIVELNTRAEGNVSFATLWSAWKTPRASIRNARSRKVVLITNGALVVGRARRIRPEARSFVCWA
jgi:hypothetical protein